MINNVVPCKTDPLSSVSASEISVIKDHVQLPDSYKLLPVVEEGLRQILGCSNILVKI